ncbi:MAG: diaminopimelate decarboxylase [Deltaproteobacteria bacterium]|nr:diaminopimelate decarboxylase [Deltaproteobacteria bacterium]
MKHFSYQKKQLHIENIPLSTLIKTYGSPTYVYSYAALKEAYESYQKAFKPLNALLCYSMKCNSNLSILRSFINLGSGIDIVSGGELFRALKAGADPKKIVFSGVGKNAEEMTYALKKGILMFNVESAQELALLDQVALKLKKQAPIALRINPNIDPKTHPYITTGMKKSKFGIQYEEAFNLYQEAQQRKGIHIRGIDCHIGSQLTQVGPFVDALERVLALVDKIQSQGIALEYLDLGGGLGIRYNEEKPPTPQAYARAIGKALSAYKLKLILEPGRSLMGNAGALLTQVLYTKDRDNKRFVIVDAAMNDLIRPAFYQSYHEILPLAQKSGKKEKVDVVGPICETGDFLATDRALPKLQSGDTLAVLSAGAYGFSMASHYNTRPKAAEVLVKGSKHYLIRKRENLKDLIKGEEIPKALQ